MSCILKPTMPISCSSELFVGCPTMIDVYDWLLKHHTTITSGECYGKTYHIFAVTDYPLFGSKYEFITTNVGIPLGPLSLEIATEIDVRHDFVPYRDQVTINVKYPLLPSVNAGTFKGDLRSGITISIGVPEIYGTIRIWIDINIFRLWKHWKAFLWVEFDLCVFGVEYKGKFAVLPIPIWLLLPSDRLIKEAALAKASIGELEAPSDDQADKTTDVVASDTSGSGEVNGAPSTDEASKAANIVATAAPVAPAIPVAA